MKDQVVTDSETRLPGTSYNMLRITPTLDTRSAAIRRCHASASTKSLCSRLVQSRADPVLQAVGELVTGGS